MSLAVLMDIGIPVVQAEQTIKIGVIHLLERPDFTLLRESFLDELQKKGYTVEVTVLMRIL